MSITADREIYALETRSESLETFSFNEFVRDGESDRVEVGTGGLIDSVEGDEEATYGSLTDMHDNNLNRHVNKREMEVNGSYRLDGKDEMLMVTGAMTETDAGGQFFAGGMSDTMLGLAGMRLTLLGDIWIAGLFGMEEKIATGVADGMLLEVSGLAFEREYVSSNYNGTFAYQSAAVTHTTAATTFLPLLKVVRGLRNQMPGSGAPASEEGEPAPATPPPAAGGAAEDATEGADGIVKAGEGAGGAADTEGVTDAVRASETVGDSATDAAQTTARTTDATTEAASPSLLSGVADPAGPGAINATETLHEMENVGDVNRAIAAAETAEDLQSTDVVRHLDEMLDAATDTTTGKLIENADDAAAFRNLSETDGALSMTSGANYHTIGAASESAMDTATNSWHLLRRFKRPPFRHPKTATRLNKLTNLSRNNYAAAQAARMHEMFNQKVLNSANVLGADAQTHSTNQEQLQSAVRNLDSMAESNSSRDNWWQVHDQMSSDHGRERDFSNDGDGRHMVDGGDIDWEEHLDELHSALEHPSPNAGENSRQAAQQALLAKDKGVFGVVNPAMQQGHAVGGLPVTGPVVGGSDAHHLLPSGADGMEIVDANAAIRAVESLDARGRPLAAQVVQGSDMGMLQELLVEFQKRMDGLRVEGTDASRPGSMGTALEVHRLGNIVAGMEASYPELDKVSGVAGAAADGEKMEDIAEGSMARLFDDTEDGFDTDSGWQAADGSADGASPALNGFGARWESIGVDAPSGTFRDKHFIRRQMPDGTYRYFLAMDGTEMKDFDAVYDALQGPPGRTALAVSELVSTMPRPDKIRGWFSSIARRLKRNRPGFGSTDSLANVGLVEKAESATDTAALLDSVPGGLGRSDSLESIASQGDEGRVVDSGMDGVAGGGSGKADAWQESMESGDYANPGRGDALESPSETRTLDSGVDLEEVDGKVVRAADKTGDGSDGAAASGIHAKMGVVEAAEAAVQLTEAEKLEAVRASLAKWDSGVAKLLDSVQAAERSDTLRSVGTLRQLRDWFGDTVAARLTTMVKDVDLDMSRHLLVAKSQDISLTDAEAIHRQVKLMHEAAVQAGDTKKADAYAEILRRAAAYVEEVNKVAERRAAEANIVESAGFNAPMALELVKADPEYQRVQDALANAADHDPTDPEAVIGAARTSYEGSAWKVVTDLLEKNQDPRASLMRYMDSRDMTLAMSRHQIDLFQEVSKQVQGIVEDVCAKTGKAVPDIKNNGKNYSVLTGDDVRSLLVAFDQTDAAGADVLAAPPTATLKDMASERLRFQKSYDAVYQSFRDGSQDKTLRTFGTMRDLGNWYTETVASRIADVVQGTDPTVTRQWLAAGASTKEHWSTETMMMCSHIVELYNAAAASGDYGLANQYVEIMRRMADYAGATKDAGEMLKLASNVAEPATFNHQMALERIMALESVQDLQCRAESMTTLSGKPITPVQYQEAVMKLSGWQIAIDLLKQGEDPRASLQRYFDASQKGAMEQVDNVRREYSKALRTAELCISIACNRENRILPDLMHDGKVYSLFDETDSSGLVAAFNKIDASFDGSAATKADSADGAALIAAEGTAHAATGDGTVVTGGAVFKGEIIESDAVLFGVTPEFPRVEVRAVEQTEGAAPTVTAVQSGGGERPMLTLPPVDTIKADLPAPAAASVNGSVGDQTVLKVTTEAEAAGSGVDSTAAVLQPLAQGGAATPRWTALDPARMPASGNAIFSKPPASNRSHQDIFQIMQSAGAYLSAGKKSVGGQRREQQQRHTRQRRHM